jgi:hypothetical protein
MSAASSSEDRSDWRSRGTAPDEATLLVIPILSYRDAPAAIDFLERAFNGRRLVVIERQDGTVGHSEVQLGSDLISVATARPDLRCF